MTRADQNFTFLLLNGLSALAFFSAIEPLRVANRLSGRNLFSWQIASVDGAPVTASNGMRLIADTRLDEAAVLIVCAGFDHQAAETPKLMAALRRIWRAGAMIGAMDTATHVLARAGLLGDRAVTMHWEAVPAFRERFPDIPVTDELFKTHDRLFTCAGGTAALDMMLDWIGRHHGAALAAAVSEQFIHERIRNAGDSQRLALSVRLGTSDPRLLAIVKAMEAHIDEPLPIATLAANASTTLVTVTGSEGTVCKLNKQPGATILAVWSCSSGDSKHVVKTAQIQNASTVLGLDVLSSGQGPGGPMCLVPSNPTSSAIAAGSVGTVPAKGIGWSCTGDGTTIASGTAVWP